MTAPVILYTPAASTAYGNAYAAHTVPFNDPVDTAYPSSDPDRVDALFFLNQVQCEILKLQQLIYAGGAAIQVRNATGSTLNNGPVRVSGYYADASSSTDTGNPIFKIVAADAAANTFANALLLTSLADATTGVAYLIGDFTPSPALDTSGGAVGDPVYLKSGGGMTLTAPTAADTMVQVIGQIKTVNATGVVAGYVQTPKKFGSSWIQSLAVTAAKIASGAAASGTPLLADGAGAAAFSGTTRVQNGGTGAATLGTSKQLLLGNGTSAVTAMAAPTTTDASADAIVGTSATTKKALVVQGLASQSVNVFEIQNSAGVTQFAISLGGPTVTGPNNTNLGVNAGSSLTLGSNNTNVGVNAGVNETTGSYNTVVGALAAGTTQATGSRNTLVGQSTDTNAAADSNATVVGQGSVGADSSTIVGEGIVSSTANDLIVRSGDTGIARGGAGILNLTNGAGSVLTRVGRTNYQTKSANYSVLQADGNSLFDVTTGSSADVTLTLPAATSALAGVPYYFRKFDAGTKGVIIAPNAADGINGNTVNVSTKITTQSAIYGLVCTGVTGINAWEVIECNGDEVESAVSAVASAATGVWKTIASITVTPGEWEFEVNGEIAGSTATVTTYFSAISTGAAGGTVGTTQIGNYAGFTASSFEDGTHVGPVRIVVAASTTYNWNVFINFSAGSCSCYGTLRARRIR